MRFHVFGNLLFFALISMHFAAQVGRPAANFPELGTGLAMFMPWACRWQLVLLKGLGLKDHLIRRCLTLKLTSLFMRAWLWYSMR
jgi:hypothetical protein